METGTQIDLQRTQHAQSFHLYTPSRNGSENLLQNLLDFLSTYYTCGYPGLYNQTPLTTIQSSQEPLKIDMPGLTVVKVRVALALRRDGR